MTISALQIGRLVEGNVVGIAPRPIFNPTSASVDLRLGRWFTTLRYSRISVLHILSQGQPEMVAAASKTPTRDRYVPFGKEYILHPGRFVLGVTLEWISLPCTIAGFITGRSSWARRGLSIEAAAGIQPGFSGCLTLEISNQGLVPIELIAGMPICQIFLHRCDDVAAGGPGQHSGRRKPSLGVIRVDETTEKLRGKIKGPRQRRGRYFVRKMRHR